MATPSLNKVFLLGNLTRDPDLRGLPSGQSVCELGLAINRRYISNGQEVDDPCYVDVVVWGKNASNCKQYLTKGSQVMVEGRLQLDRWEDRNGGGQRSRLRVVAENVQFLSRRSADGGNYSDGGNYGQNQGGYQPQGNSYPAQGGNYPSGGNNYAPRSSSYSEGTYSRAARPADPGRPAPGMDLPPMPDPGIGSDPAALEDDIPF